jgi:bla regulator protein blaR1
MSTSKSLLLRAVGLMAVCVAMGHAKTTLRPPQTASDAAPTTRTPPVPAWQVAAGGKMEFEAASVRQDTSGVFKPPSIALSADDGSQPKDGLFHADFPLSVYIQFAYKLMLAPERRNAMLAPLPKWVSTDIFEMQGRAAGKPTKDQMRLMVQSLLAERFGLKVHFENQMTPVLALVQVKPGELGPHLTAHIDFCEASKTAAANGAGKSDVSPPPCLDGSFIMVSAPKHLLRMGSRNVTMALVATSLPTLGGLGRPVVDQTGLSGSFDFWIEFAPQPHQAASRDTGAPPPEEGPTVLEAVSDQLGLKLERTTAPLDVPAIDHIDRPSEN